MCDAAAQQAVKPRPSIGIQAFVGPLRQSLSQRSGAIHREVKPTAARPPIAGAGTRMISPWRGKQGMTQTALQRGPSHVDLSCVPYLIVDRNRFTRKLLSQVLRNFSAVDVRKTSDFTAALNMTRKRAPAVAFIGLSADWTDELNFLRALRRTGRAAPCIPAIMIADPACTEGIAIATALGADDYITVPFCVATVEAHLVKLLKDGGLHRTPR
jgi:CheY-like chemotaxis protein